jgi:hypothetical protein
MELNQPKRITYLFGAGASRGNGELLDKAHNINFAPSGVPTVDAFNRDIGFFLNYMPNLDSPVDKDNASSRLEEMRTRFNEVYLRFANMYSFDTYAKSLKEKGLERDLNDLKLLLKAYLIYRQTLCTPDPRYDLLFATLINNNNLPSHVNFLSWNYDTQVEISLSKFSNSSKDPFKDFIQLGTGDKNNNKSFLLKLNGTISVKKQLDKFYHCEFRKSVNPSKQAWDEIVSLYSNDQRDYFWPHMYFSWENKKAFGSVFDHALEIMSVTDILIVIGYSFPTLNRKVDKTILEKLSGQAKIYVQCGNEVDFKEIKSKIESLAPKFADRVDSGTQVSIPSKVIFVPQNKEFYVPFEFEN